MGEEVEPDYLCAKFSKPNRKSPGAAAEIENARAGNVSKKMFDGWTLVLGEGIISRSEAVKRFTAGVPDFLNIERHKGSDG